jgi:hypothetical protein
VGRNSKPRLKVSDARGQTLTRVPLPHCPRHVHRVVIERLEDHRPFEPAVAIALFCLLLRGDVLGG